jgi:hypothetical protein
MLDLAAATYFLFEQLFRNWILHLGIAVPEPQRNERYDNDWMLHCTTPGYVCAISCDDVRIM